MGECKAGTRLTMTPYVPLGIGGVAVIVALVLMFTPTECFVMENDNPYHYIAEGPHCPIICYDVGINRYNDDGSIFLTKKIHSELEGSDIIIVQNPPNTVLEAIMFWADEGATIINHDKVALRSYHIECTDHASQTVQWLYPSAFPNSIHEHMADIP